MIGGRVQRVEAMPLRLDVRPVRERETHAAKNRDRAIQQLRDRMQRPLPRKARRRPRQRHIHAGKGRLVRIALQCGFAFIERGSHRRAHVVQQFSDARFVVLTHILHSLAQRRKRALLAEKFDARLLDRRLIRGSGDGGDGFGPELFEWSVHVWKNESRRLPIARAGARAECRTLLRSIAL